MSEDLHNTDTGPEFVTGLRYRDEEYLGIVVNTDSHLITFYDFGSIPDQESRVYLMKLGEIWWWQSNRQIPIDIFLNLEMKVFKPYMKTFVIKDTEILFGPVTSLQNLIKKRIKRKTVQLIRKMD